ncbi:C-terminal binding protein [soil metagenome]
MVDVEHHPVVLITDYAWPSLDIEQEILGRVGATLLVAARGDEAELVNLAPQADAILTCWQKVTPNVLDAARTCRIVARYGIGLDNIAVDHATSLGIPVTNVPDFCLDEVSDHAMALILSCARRIVAFASETRSGTWNPSAAQQLRRVRGKTLGIVGHGAIARTLIPKARAFGLDILVFTPRIEPGEIEPGVNATNDLYALLVAADFVSIHAPATTETRNLIDATALKAMNPSAWLINTSRGALVDEAALINALRSGQISGAALDVLAAEPPESSNPLLSMENVIITPHVAFSSEEAVQDLQRDASQRVLEALSGEVPGHLVNPSVLDSPQYSRRLEGIWTVR